ncbi:MAG: MFS transporter, partial [Halobacteria archaeon]|nr:MFS transporter [Halobacteria archaeon]
TDTDTDKDRDLSIDVFGKDHLLDPIFTLGVVTLFVIISISLLSTIEPQVNARLDQTTTMFGIQFAMFVLAQILLVAPLGAASDRYGRRPFLVAGLILLIPTTLAQGLVTTPLQMVVARFVQGAAGAVVFAPSLALAGDLAGEGESGTKLSVLTMAFGLGTALGPLSSGVLVQFGYIVPFAFGSLLAAIGAVLIYTQVEETLWSESAEDVEPAEGIV